MNDIMTDRSIALVFQKVPWAAIVDALNPLGLVKNNPHFGAVQFVQEDGDDEFVEVSEYERKIASASNFCLQLWTSSMSSVLGRFSTAGNRRLVVMWIDGLDATEEAKLFALLVKRTSAVSTDDPLLAVMLYGIENINWQS